MHKLQNKNNRIDPLNWGDNFFSMIKNRKHAIINLPVVQNFIGGQWNDNYQNNKRKKMVKLLSRDFPRHIRNRFEIKIGQRPKQEPRTISCSIKDIEIDIDFISDHKEFGQKPNKD